MEPEYDSVTEQSTSQLGGKRKKKKSNSWAHFTRCEGEPRAACNYCGKTYACHSVRNGTTNMNNHLKVCENYLATVVDESEQSSKPQDISASNTNPIVVSINKEECRKACAKMVILDELSFSFVEGKGFRYFCHVACPEFEPPSRRTLVRDVYQLYLDEKIALKNVFIAGKIRVCLTTDTWSSIQNISYMVVTAHFVDPNWQLQKKILSFSRITNHKGDMIGKEIETVLHDWGIDRVLTITVDNASANDVAVKYVKRKLKSWQVDGTLLGGKFLHIRCCAHIVNLIVGEGLKELKGSVASIRNAVRYVRSSPAREDRFRKCVEHEKIKSRGSVVLDVATRWNSTYLMLDSAFKFRKAFERLEEEDEHYRNYFKEDVNENDNNNIGPPKPEDWDNANVFVQFLKTFHDVTLKFSASLTVTSNLYLHRVSTIQSQLTTMSQGVDCILSKMATNMKKKFDKYWGSVENMNQLLIIAVVLDPRYKLEYVSFCFESLYDANKVETMTSSIKKELLEIYNCYHVFYSTSSNVVLSCEVGVEENESHGNIFDMEEAFKRKKRKKETDVGKSEVETYLADPSEDSYNEKFDVLSWWKNHCTKYPTLSCIAKEVFAIPVSTVASESAFSTGGRILDPFRSSLTLKMVEALICSQNWLQSSFSSNEEIHVNIGASCIQDLELYQSVQSDLEKSTTSFDATTIEMRSFDELSR